jgi:hypothetical protein
LADQENVVRGREFTDETVVLDGTEFIGCRLVRCELLYSGGRPFLFENTAVEECRLTFVGRAENTIHTLAAMHEFGMRNFVEEMFELIRNPELAPAFD